MFQVDHLDLALAWDGHVEFVDEILNPREGSGRGHHDELVGALVGDDLRHAHAVFIGSASTCRRGRLDALLAAHRLDPMALAGFAFALALGAEDFFQGGRQFRGHGEVDLKDSDFFLAQRRVQLVQDAHDSVHVGARVRDDQAVGGGVWIAVAIFGGQLLDRGVDRVRVDVLELKQAGDHHVEFRDVDLVTDVGGDGVLGGFTFHLDLVKAPHFDHRHVVHVQRGEEGPIGFAGRYGGVGQDGDFAATDAVADDEVFAGLFANPLDDFQHFGFVEVHAHSDMGGQRAAALVFILEGGRALVVFWRGLGSHWAGGAFEFSRGLASSSAILGFSPAGFAISILRPPAAWPFDLLAGAAAAGAQIGFGWVHARSGLETTSAGWSQAWAVEFLDVAQIGSRGSLRRFLLCLLRQKLFSVIRLGRTRVRVGQQAQGHETRQKQGCDHDDFLLGCLFDAIAHLLALSPAGQFHVDGASSLKFLVDL